ncbi:MAG: sulfur oxidation c-type cytochrome SoxA [Bradyrhizobium sp.]|uniref:sulfur oxidation c-type cytochrome SoxA n=1 Tax=Bradyrhizobium sp. TaxID=376 RepID=UPI00271789EC|nr:sulfur oxidation c-type cytochrome SoxA [Bradyrhizobium sp.]MDO8397955.1 sulfur oxidation c-type cytochrome SoxA [Bradyrhizobium sp.]
MLRTTFLAAAVAIAAPALSAEIPHDQRQSSYELMSPDTRAMQDEDTSNPGMLWVLEGEALWKRETGEANRSCADCHGDATQSMKGVAARHPAFDEKRREPVDLEGRINICRTEQQKAPASARESRDILALSAFIARQSRGMPIESSDERLRPFIEKGRSLFTARQGQLNLTCAQCHDDNWGQKLAGIPVPQAHPTGYPLYRLEWQALGSLQRRLRNCMIGMRAEAYVYGAPEYIALETFVKWRARGMPMESPAVRP